MQTDTSRAQLLELQIQARVAEELKKLQAKEAEALKAAHDRIAAEEPAHPPLPLKGGAQTPQEPSRHGVSKEVEALRSRLEGRRRLRELPESVESARSEVIRCLRDNDRRPLDCWQEVEKFKDEVRRLEKGWVEKVVG